MGKILLGIAFYHEGYILLMNITLTKNHLLAGRKYDNKN